MTQLTKGQQAVLYRLLEMKCTDSAIGHRCSRGGCHMITYIGLFQPAEPDVSTFWPAKSIHQASDWEQDPMVNSKTYICLIGQE